MKPSGDVVPSGLPAVPELGWGAHLCQLYRRRAELVETLVPYLREGLHGGERCLWVTSDPLGVEDARSLLRSAVPDADERERRGQLEILDGEQWYRAAGGLDAEQTVRGWRRFQQETLDRGWNGVRLTANTTWLRPEERPGFMDYERRVHEAFQGQRIVALCTYHASDCSAEETLDLCRSHELALLRRGDRWDTVPATRPDEEPAMPLDQLLGLVSHELRSPLNGIRLASERLRRTKDLQRVPVVAARMARCAQRMGRLVDDFEALARTGLGDAPSLRRSYVDLRELCETACDELRPLHPDRDIVLAVHGESHGHWDPDRLHQVVTNLLNNALRHGEGEVRIELEDAGGAQRIRCHNRGRPIPPEQRERIFAPFHSERGLGIGLYVVRELVRAHGGTIALDSDESRGTTFEVSLPRSEDDAETG